MILNLNNYISQHRVNAVKCTSNSVEFLKQICFDFHSSLNQVYKSESVIFKFFYEHSNLCFVSTNGLYKLTFFPVNYCLEISNS